MIGLKVSKPPIALLLAASVLEELMARLRIPDVAVALEFADRIYKRVVEKKKIKKIKLIEWF